MSSNLILILNVVLSALVPIGIALYGAYWAFSIRRALAGRVYRNHALWLGALCIVLIVGMPLDSITSSSVLVNLGINILIFFELAFFFAFVDSVVPVARRSDPLLRRVLHWEKLRYVLWADLALAAVYLVYSGVDPNFSNGGFWGAIGFPLFLLPFIFGAPVVLIGALRSKDYVLRDSLKWFGVLIVFFLFNALISFIEIVILNISQYDSTYSLPALAFVPGSILRAYAIYRSCRSLAPVSRLQAAEQRPTSAP